MSDIYANRYSIASERRKARFITEYNRITREVLRKFLIATENQKDDWSLCADAYKLLNTDLLVEIMWFLADFGIIDIPSTYKR